MSFKPSPKTPNARLGLWALSMVQTLPRKTACQIALMPSAQNKLPNIAPRLLKWFDKNGRKNLPWQHPITPYRVWLSEVMLQQTQVETVTPYFIRFIETFPSVHDLANAPLDEVLHLWTGLGYYARARNLHKCAKIISSDYHGRFPNSLEALASLPGIGRSTAAAIASIAFEQATAILDGNVKRVLARYHTIEGWPGNKAVENSLWQCADFHMPHSRCRDYTQAIMDLGATVCKRSRPLCDICPLSKNCRAFHEDLIGSCPGKKPKKTLPVKTTQMLLIRNTAGNVLLKQRPQQGIWGGLWSFPEIASDEDFTPFCKKHYGTIKAHEKWLTIRHTFSHFHLEITPVLVELKREKRCVKDDVGQIWYDLINPQNLGLAAPVKKLLNHISQPELALTND